MTEKETYKFKVTSRQIEPIYGGGPTQFMFAFCSKPEGGKISKVSKYAACRETLIVFAIEAKSGSPKNKDIDFKAMRLLVGVGMTSANHEKSRKLFLAKMEKGLRAINILEKKFGWPLTTLETSIQPTTDPYYGNYMPIVMFVGAAKWMRSPHMVSLFGLLVRVGWRMNVKEKTGYKELMEKAKTFAETNRKDANHVRLTHKFWPIIMQNFNSLFKGLPTTRNFNTQRAFGHDSWYASSNEGITLLCKGASSDAVLKERLKKLKQAEG